MERLFIIRDWISEITDYQGVSKLTGTRLMKPVQFEGYNKRFVGIMHLVYLLQLVCVLPAFV